jgi:hypothetical protein
MITVMFPRATKAPTPSPTRPAAEEAPEAYPSPFADLRGGDRSGWLFCWGIVAMLANALLFGVWLVNAMAS